MKKLICILFALMMAVVTVSAKTYHIYRGVSSSDVVYTLYHPEIIVLPFSLRLSSPHRLLFFSIFCAALNAVLLFVLLFAAD